MGWDKGRYYSRSRKISGRVVREYVGRGQAAALVAQMDAIAREERQAARAARRAECAELDKLNAELNDLDELTQLVVNAALVAAGFHQHKRSEWRKTRGNKPAK